MISWYFAKVAMTLRINDSLLLSQSRLGNEMVVSISIVLFHESGFLVLLSVLQSNIFHHRYGYKT